VNQPHTRAQGRPSAGEAVCRAVGAGGLGGSDGRLRLASLGAVEGGTGLPPFTEWHSFAQSASTLGSRAAAAQNASAPRRAWMHGQRDPWLRTRAREAHVIVALDANAVYTVWELARINTGAHACYGVAAASRAVADRRERPLHYARTNAVFALPSPRALVRTAGPRTRRLFTSGAIRATEAMVHRAGFGAGVWRPVVALPGLPDDLRPRPGKRLALCP